MADPRTLRAAMPILLGAAIMLTFSMGIRQSFGLFMPPLTREIALTVSDFTLAIVLGAFGGGLLFDVFGSYDLAWRLGVGMGLTAGGVQIVAAIIRPQQFATTRHSPLQQGPTVP